MSEFNDSQAEKSWAEKWIRGQKRVAIVAVRDSSIDLIFRGRKLDCFSETYDAEVLERTLELVRKNEHDVIVAYQQE